MTQAESVITNRLNTVEEVIAGLGGPQMVAELAGRGDSISLVPTWKYRGQFPTKTFTVMQAALRERGLSAPNHLWGMP